MKKKKKKKKLKGIKRETEGNKKKTLLTMNQNEKPKNHFPYKPQLRHHR